MKTEKSVVNHTKRLANYSHSQRSMVKDTYQTITGEKQRTDPLWQRILQGSPLLLGSSYSNGRTGVQFVLGVPTVRRVGENYLLETVAHLIEKLSDYQRNSCLIVIYIGETDSQIVESIWKEIGDSFGYHLDDGLIDVISPPVNYYPDFESLFITLHDDPNRVRWRTKQVLDYMYLMTYASSRGSYYLQLEDDIEPTVGYLDYIIQLKALHTHFRLDHHRGWIVLSFSELGFIGKLFHVYEIKPFLAHVQNFYNDQPIDWLLYSYVKLRSCPWDSFNTADCERDFFMNYIRATQSQFQHIGVESSLRSKEQKLRDERYERNSGQQIMEHLRRPLNLVTSHTHTFLQDRRHFGPGETFMWSYVPQVSLLMRYLLSHLNDFSQIKIGNGCHRENDSFSELTVNLYKKAPIVDGSHKRRFGFLLSYTHQIEAGNPHILYFYMTENAMDSNESNWIGRFNWTNKGTSLNIDMCVKIWFLLWSLI
ncbi:alpha-1,3-mannosyl-glycoprotein 4-beta-N-acetylglucosaminyltransferase A [Drosophila novamexicana]|uniref:alpha-1,3-mannosyl-glycoprotein 4-beta-N-acetylglucosaminyltransferase A n=1 Tax=Drosophila novamexicana TaxID=47314 RepID=UPI0011E5E927|nr:alpha-1,3-mannosyl-glycoprotein 4-beta-N-acetylglucosaminyltransferase A [Drosophila novamexicana]